MSLKEKYPYPLNTKKKQNRNIVTLDERGEGGSPFPLSAKMVQISIPFSAISAICPKIKQISVSVTSPFPLSAYFWLIFPLSDKNRANFRFC